MEEKFEIKFLEEAWEFLHSIDAKASDKIIYNIRVVKKKNDVALFKKLTDNIWEFRTFYNKTHYRLFAFWDKGENTFVVATHGLIKKTDKTPWGDLEKAERLRKDYFISKITVS